MVKTDTCKSARPFTCSAVLLAALAAGSAWSAITTAGDHKYQDSKTSSQDEFKRCDTDGDGRLSRDEYEKMKKDKHAGTSEVLSGQGMPATDHQAETVRGFDDLDADGDGYVSANELDRERATDGSISSQSGGATPGDTARSGSGMQGDAAGPGTSMPDTSTQHDAMRPGTSMQGDRSGSSAMTDGSRTPSQGTAGQGGKTGSASTMQ